MRLKIFLTMPTEKVPVNNLDMLISFIHKCLGKNNKYHDAFSKYCISSLQGGKLDKDGFLSFDNSEPYIIVSSIDNEFIETFVKGLYETKATVMSMSFNRLEIPPLTIQKYYDNVMTISPILLKNKSDRKITFEDPEWLDLLNQKTVAKLKNVGIEDPTFKIELRSPDKAKRKLVWVGDVFNPSSMVSLKITGTKKAREAVYNMGLGNSTGCGFGAVKTYDYPIF